MKETPPGIHPRTECAKFQPNRTIFEVSSAPQSFSLVLAKNSSPGLKNQNFWKMKKTPPDIHPRNKCAKFQPNSTIFEASSTDRQTDKQTLSDSSSTEVENSRTCELHWAQLVFYQLFIGRIVAIVKNTSPGIRPRNNKWSKLQPNSTIFEVFKMPKSLKHREIETDRHSQILAQLKSKIVFLLPLPFSALKWIILEESTQFVYLYKVCHQPLKLI